MSIVGRQVTLPELNNQVSGLLIQLRDTLDGILHVETWLSNQTDADLEAIGIVGPDPIFLLRAAIQDVAKFARIYTGDDTQGTAHDFSNLASKLTGIS